MKTTQYSTEAFAKQYQRNTALGVYIICISAFGITYSLVTAVTVL